MKQPWRTLGWLWALPLTLFGLIYTTLFTVFGWYTNMGRHGDALVWNINHDRMPVLLQRAWRHWNGHTVGNVVVINGTVDTHRGRITLRHEQEHVRQGMVLGVFLPVFYSISYLGLKFCTHAHPYYDNPFEIDARRAAGQVVDVIGALKRAVAEGRIKVPPKKNT
jgi:hypothetical protein